MAKTWTKTAVNVTWTLFSGLLTLVPALAGLSSGLLPPLFNTQTLELLKSCRTSLPSSLVLELGEAGVRLCSYHC